MRIVNKDIFLVQPAGTLFSKYSETRGGIGELMIKSDTWAHGDFLYQDIRDAIENMGSEDWQDKLDDSQHNGTELAMDFDCLGRDGCFEDDQLYAIWSDEDRLALIKRLEMCGPLTKSKDN